MFTTIVFYAFVHGTNAEGGLIFSFPDFCPTLLLLLPNTFLSRQDYCFQALRILWNSTKAFLAAPGAWNKQSLIVFVADFISIE